MEDANKLCIVDVDSEKRVKYAVGSNHNIIKIWNLDSDSNTPIVERTSPAKINSEVVSSRDIYVAYGGDITSSDLKISDKKLSHQNSKALSPGSKARSIKAGMTTSQKYVITVWKWYGAIYFVYVIYLCSIVCLYLFRIFVCMCLIVFISYSCLYLLHYAVCVLYRDASTGLATGGGYVEQCVDR